MHTYPKKGEGSRAYRNRMSTFSDLKILVSIEGVDNVAPWRIFIYRRCGGRGNLRTPFRRRIHGLSVACKNNRRSWGIQ
jgi:hypothetical protein